MFYDLVLAQNGHTYNGGSQMKNANVRRCTIMTKINRGHTLHHENFKHINCSGVLNPYLLKKFKYDIVRFYCNYCSFHNEYHSCATGCDGHGGSQIQSNYLYQIALILF